MVCLMRHVFNLIALPLISFLLAYIAGAVFDPRYTFLQNTALWRGAWGGVLILMCIGLLLSRKQANDTVYHSYLTGWEISFVLSMLAFVISLTTWLVNFVNEPVPLFSASMIYLAFLLWGGGATLMAARARWFDTVMQGDSISEGVAIAGVTVVFWSGLMMACIFFSIFMFPLG
jgi:hypothetical protein